MKTIIKPQLVGIFLFVTFFIFESTLSAQEVRTRVSSGRARPSRILSDWQSDGSSFTLNVTSDLKEAVTGKLFAELYRNNEKIASFKQGKEPIVRVEPGIKIIPVSTHIADVSIVEFFGDAGITLARTKILPEGNYRLCAWLEQTDFTSRINIIGRDECASFTLEQISRPSIINPPSGSTINVNQPLMVTWTPIQSLSGNQEYHLRVVPVYPNQDSRAAFASNRPIYEQTTTQANLLIRIPTLDMLTEGLGLRVDVTGGETVEGEVATYKLMTVKEPPSIESMCDSIRAISQRLRDIAASMGASLDDIGQAMVFFTGAQFFAASFPETQLAHDLRELMRLNLELDKLHLDNRICFRTIPPSRDIKPKEVIKLEGLLTKTIPDPSCEKLRKGYIYLRKARVMAEDEQKLLPEALTNPKPNDTISQLLSKEITANAERIGKLIALEAKVIQQGGKCLQDWISGSGLGLPHDKKDSGGVGGAGPNVPGPGGPGTGKKGANFLGDARPGGWYPYVPDENKESFCECEGWVFDSANGWKWVWVECPCSTIAPQRKECDDAQILIDALGVQLKGAQDKAAEAAKNIAAMNAANSPIGKATKAMNDAYTALQSKLNKLSSNLGPGYNVGINLPNQPGMSKVGSANGVTIQWDDAMVSDKEANERIKSDLINKLLQEAIDANTAYQQAQKDVSQEMAKLTTEEQKKEEAEADAAAIQKRIDELTWKLKGCLGTLKWMEGKSCRCEHRLKADAAGGGIGPGGPGLGGPGGKGPGAGGQGGPGAGPNVFGPGGKPANDPCKQAQRDYARQSQAIEKHAKDCGKLLQQLNQRLAYLNKLTSALKKEQDNLEKAKKKTEEAQKDLDYRLNEIKGALGKGFTVSVTPGNPNHGRINSGAIIIEWDRNIIDDNAASAQIDKNVINNALNKANQAYKALQAAQQNQAKAEAKLAKAQASFNNIAPQVQAEIARLEAELAKCRQGLESLQTERQKLVNQTKPCLDKLHEKQSAKEQALLKRLGFK